MKIIVFSPDYFKMHMEELAGSLTTASELQVVGYDDFEDLLDLYPQYEDRADCFLFTSATALYVGSMCSRRRISPASGSSSREDSSTE